MQTKLVISGEHKQWCREGKSWQMPHNEGLGGPLTHIAVFFKLVFKQKFSRDIFLKKSAKIAEALRAPTPFGFRQLGALTDSRIVSPSYC